MKMFKKFLVVLMVSVVLFASSCKKTSNSNGGPYAGRVATVSSVLNYTSTPVVTNYYYDGQGRVASTNYGTYSYSGSTITYNTSGTVETITLNAQGYQQTDGYSTYTYYYDANGYLTSKVSPTDTIVYGYSNGDLVVIADKSSAGTTTTTYTYSSLADNRNFGEAWAGTRSAHILASMVVTGPTGTVTTNRAYTYTVDNQGRVSTLTYTSLISNSTTTITYTYY